MKGQTINLRAYRVHPLVNIGRDKPRKNRVAEASKKAATPKEPFIVYMDRLGAGIGVVAGCLFMAVFWVNAWRGW